LAEWSARREAAKVAALASEADATRQRILCEFVERAPDSQYFPRTSRRDLTQSSFFSVHSKSE
jgi:hypothetical protein